MQWFRASQNLIDDPRLADWRRKLGVSKAESIGIWMMFILWCQKYAEDGFITNKQKCQVGHMLAESVRLPANAPERSPGEWFQDLVDHDLVVPCKLHGAQQWRVTDWWAAMGGWLGIKYKTRSAMLSRIRKLHNVVTTLRQPSNNTMTTMEHPTEEKRREETRQDKKDKTRKAKQEKSKSCVQDTPRHTFTPPTKEQLTEFCKTNNITIDEIYFLHYYTSKGWMVGKSPMKNWQAAVHTWLHRDKTNPNGGSNGLESTKWGRPGQRSEPGQRLSDEQLSTYEQNQTVLDLSKPDAL